MADALNVKKISAFTANDAPADTDCFLTATGNVAKKTTVAQAKELFGVSSGLKLLEATMVKFKVPSTASGAHTNITTAFNAVDGATVFVPVCLASGWLAPSSCSAIAGSLNVGFINPTANTHSTDAAFIVLQFAEF